MFGSFLLPAAPVILKSGGAEADLDGRKNAAALWDSYSKGGGPGFRKNSPLFGAFQNVNSSRGVCYIPSRGAVTVYFRQITYQKEEFKRDYRIINATAPSFLLPRGYGGGPGAILTFSASWPGCASCLFSLREPSLLLRWCAFDRFAF